jgi:hypothetical protein
VLVHGTTRREDLRTSNHYSSEHFNNASVPASDCRESKHNALGVYRCCCDSRRAAPQAPCDLRHHGEQFEFELPSGVNSYTSAGPVPRLPHRSAIGCAILPLALLVPHSAKPVKWSPRLPMLLVKNDFLMLDITLSGYHFVRIDTRGSAAYAPSNHVAEHSDYLSTAEGGKYQSARRETGRHAPGI